MSLLDPFPLLWILGSIPRHKCVQLIAITFTQRVEGFSIVPRSSLFGAYHLITKHGRCVLCRRLCMKSVVTNIVLESEVFKDETVGSNISNQFSAKTVLHSPCLKFSEHVLMCSIMRLADRPLSSRGSSSNDSHSSAASRSCLQPSLH